MFKTDILIIGITVEPPSAESFIPVPFFREKSPVIYILHMGAMNVSFGFFAKDFSLFSV
jgi:hypothetical protein